jgi:hypothetical protein
MKIGKGELVLALYWVLFIITPTVVVFYLWGVACLSANFLCSYANR